MLFVVSFECHCGDTRKLSPLLDKCKKPCSGNSRMNCGGNWLITVYNVQINGKFAVRPIDCLEEYISIGDDPNSGVTVSKLTYKS